MTKIRLFFIFHSTSNDCKHKSRSIQISLNEVYQQFILYICRKSVHKPWFTYIKNIYSIQLMILLSFDIEEFDVPLEHKVEIPLERQMIISIEGTQKILACLRKYKVQATFFCTANFAAHAPEVIKSILEDGHEIASHGYYHSSFEPADLKKSREFLEQLIGMPVRGYRMARMMPVDEKEIRNAGYSYNSSLNPTFIPERYIHLNQPRTWFYKEEVLQIPASVTPWFRFPLFWLSYHNLPSSLYLWLCKRTLRHDGYFVTYFHPWEFYPLGDYPELNLPFIIRNHSGKGMEDRLCKFIQTFQSAGEKFVTFTEFASTKNQNLKNIG